MVRDVFRLARENTPSIIFIDEIDSIATKYLDILMNEQGVLMHKLVLIGRFSGF